MGLGSQAPSTHSKAIGPRCCRPGLAAQAFGILLHTIREPGSHSPRRGPDGRTVSLKERVPGPGHAPKSGASCRTPSEASVARLASRVSPGALPDHCQPPGWSIRRGPSLQAPRIAGTSAGSCSRQLCKAPPLIAGRFVESTAAIILSRGACSLLRQCVSPGSWQQLSAQATPISVAPRSQGAWDASCARPEAPQSSQSRALARRPSSTRGVAGLLALMPLQ